jgi:RimJ/RimL family protein N-acetyltransferase
VPTQDDHRQGARQETEGLWRLETERLLLRQPTPDDLPSYVAVLGEDDAEREHRDAVAHWRAHGFGPWVVEEDGEPVGVLEVHYAGPGVSGIEAHEVEIGWTVAEARRGRGIAVEAGRAAMADTFERARPNRHGWIVAYIRPENAVSQRVAERIGLRLEADGLTRSGDAMQIWRARP